MGGGDSGAAAHSARVPQLAASGSSAGAHYAAWRPQMETFLMRHGLEARDYKKELPQWQQLETKAQESAIADEDAAMALLLDNASAVSQPTSDNTSTSSRQLGAPAPADAKERAKRVVADIVARSKRAYGYLFAALPEDLRLLVADVPRGYAYGLWTFLERRFQNTEQDNVADLWAQFTALQQHSGESFDAYKARVDTVRVLLEHAKQPIPAGLYAHLLLGKLQPLYAQAVLALKAGGRVAAADSIDWPAIVTFINNHERQVQRQDEGEAEGERALAARGVWKKPPKMAGGAAQRSHPSSKPRQQSSHDQTLCYNCEGLGHIAAHCKKPLTERTKQAIAKRAQASGGQSTQRNGATSESDLDDNEQKRAYSARVAPGNIAHPQANGPSAVLFGARSLNRFSALQQPDYDCRQHDATTRSSPHAMSFVGAAAGVQATKASSPAQPQLRRLLRPAEVQAREATKQKERERRTPRVDAPKAPSTRTLDVDLKTHSWGVDSMASQSCTGTREALINVRRCAPLSIKLADGAVIIAMYKGTAELRLYVEGRDQGVVVRIDDVYYHERFDANLLSWGHMRLAGWESHSTKEHTYLITPGKKRVLASTRGKLTILDGAQPAGRAYAAAGVHRSSIGRVVCTSSDDLVRLHERLGHVGWDRLLSICEAGQTDGVGELRLNKEQLATAQRAVQECTACIRTKMTRTALGHRGLDHGQRPGQVLHIDTAEVSLQDERDNNRKHVAYWLVVIDPYSEGRVSAIVDRKSDLPQKVTEAIRRFHAMTSKPVRAVYVDQGSEFMNGIVQNVCKQNGIDFNPSPARQKEQHGIAERGVRSYKTGARAMLDHARGLHWMWRHAADHQAYVWNRSRIAKRTGVTPYQSLMGRTPSLLHVGVFGCDVWVHRDRSQRETTFDVSAEPGIYLGHHGHQRGANVLLLRSNKVVFTRDVEYREQSFRHMRALREGTVQSLLNQHPYEPLGDDDADEASHDSTPCPAFADDAGDLSEDGATAPHADSDTSAADDEATEYDVEEVLSHRGSGPKLQYQVRWRGFSDPTWEPARNLANAHECVQEYNDRRLASVVPKGRSGLRSGSASSGRVAAATVVTKQVRTSDAPLLHAYEHDNDNDDDDDAVLSHPAARAALGAVGCSRL